MRIEMNMPQMGESIAEGTILKWKKGIGDSVKRDEEILEISTDKVDTEIPCPADGVILEILVKEGETVPVKTLLAIIETDLEAAKVGAQKSVDTKPASTPVAQGGEVQRPSSQDSSPHDGSDAGNLKVKEFKRKTADATTSSSTGSSSGKSTFLSPLVQNIAAENNIPISEVSQINGTGREGRVTKQDILAYIEEKKSGVKPTPAPIPTPYVPSASVSQPAAASVAPSAQASSVWVGANDEIVEMDRMRRMIADHMVRSVHTSPHVVSFSEIDMNAIVDHRNRIKDNFKLTEGFNLTFTSYFIYLAARALKKFPYINSSVDGYRIILRKQINIGFAVELPSGGLIVPVIKGVDALNLVGVARGLQKLAEKARANRLDPDDISGGTFTVTNVGVFGNISGAPIINQPQVAILGTGAVRKVPAVIETPVGDAIAIRQRMIVSMSYDHRIIDGAMAGRFMGHLKELMENFNE